MTTTPDSRYPSDWDQRRRQIYRRDDYQCQRCGIRGGPHGDVELHAHHVVPVSNGGSHAPENLLTLCWSCHNTVHDHYVPRATELSGTERQTAEHDPLPPPTADWDRDDRFADVLHTLDPAEYTPPSRPFVEYWIALLWLYEAIINVHEGRYRETFDQRSRLVDSYWARTGNEADALLAAARAHCAVVEERFVAFEEAHDAVDADLHRHVDFVYERTATYVDAIRGWTEAIEGLLTADTRAQAQTHADEFYRVTFECGEPVGPETDPPWLPEMIDLINEVGTNVRARIEPATDPSHDDIAVDSTAQTPPPAASDRPRRETNHATVGTILGWLLGVAGGGLFLLGQTDLDRLVGGLCLGLAYLWVRWASAAG